MSLLSDFVFLDVLFFNLKIAFFLNLKLLTSKNDNTLIGSIFD